MNADTVKVRLILGLKIKQLRLDKKLSQQELAQRVGLAHSYLNEIEKGKKYPRAEKMMALAQALDTTYDSLVSLKLDKKLEPIADLLNSRILTELPLSMFGLDPADFLQLMSEAPAKLSAFVNTLIELARNYDMRMTQFYFSVLRTYQEIHDNYFPELEEASEQFLQQFLAGKHPTSPEPLIQVLTEQYGYQIQYFSPETHPGIGSLRSVFVPDSGKTLFLNQQMTLPQLLFTLTRECGYQYLHITERPLESSVIEPISFEHILNNFRASYFAGATLIPRQDLQPLLEDFFSQTTWQPDRLRRILETFQATPELFLQRLTNLLTSHFQLKNLFFLRFDYKPGDIHYSLVKELHLTKLHQPHGTALREHYCRRWVSLRILQNLSGQMQSNHWNDKPLIDSQISQYIGTSSKYWVLSIAKPSPPKAGVISSISVGIEMDAMLEKQVQFLADPQISHWEVGETCERCPATDCAQRAKEPTVLQEKHRLDQLKEAVKKLVI